MVKKLPTDDFTTHNDFATTSCTFAMNGVSSTASPDLSGADLT